MTDCTVGGDLTVNDDLILDEILYIGEGTNKVVLQCSSAGSLHLNRNLVWTGSQWNRLDTSEGGVSISVYISEITFRFCGSGSNPASLVEKARIDSSGNMSLAGTLSENDY